MHMGDRNIEILNVFAEAVQSNEWVPSVVYDFSETLKLQQNEILYEKLDPYIHDLIHHLLRESGEGGYGAEVGAILVYLSNKTVDLEFVTSNRRDGIDDTDNDIALDKLLDRVDGQAIERVQYYHTHPKGGILSMTLSQADVTETNRLQQRLQNSGIFCPLDMHAIPFELSYNGMFEIFTKPPLGKPPFDENGNYIKRESVAILESPSTYKAIVPRVVRVTLNPEQALALDNTMDL